ncbi:hypothetical protein [Stieleria varia]|uniref:Uncharacterized protein n=1 Tax=Stieleria varia TaxID=2528005 RepID=A0A5C6AT30_9BACT|nr:hypothetical protein [Stieleria varia]TWU02870.1 hypothetical protein Pla52n_39300 [Stieleria varia]
MSRHAMSPDELRSEIQSAVDAIVQETHEADWSEDFLSLSLVMKVREVLGTAGGETEPDAARHSFDLQAYKITGEAESKHGDIAFVVTRQTLHGPMTGVGFYEAKASIDGHRYPTFDFRQLQRLCTKTPRLSYLFYSKDGGNAESCDWPTAVTAHDFPRFKVRTVDANYLRRCRNPNAALHTHGLTFGHHFVNRLLSGRDLDYSRSPENAVKRWLDVTRRATAIIVSVVVQDTTLPRIEIHPDCPGYPDAKRLTFENDRPRLT